MKIANMGALAVLAAVGMASAASASVIPALTSITPDGSDYLWSYQGQLAPDQGVISGDMLVIVDFSGYVAGSVSSSLPDVTASVSNTLPADLLLPPGLTDNPSIPDLIFTYNGPAFDTSGGPFGSDTNFDGLSAESIYGDTQLGVFSAIAIKNNGPETGTTAYNTGFVAVPVGDVPEPSTWALMLLGVGGLGYALRRGSRSTLAIA